MTRNHCVCGKLAPTCPAHREESDADLAARITCALMCAARDRCLVGVAS